tara:strand:- start:187 stop:390 length:204 start_codon:yes stop_codon:yes gene_type:complete
MKQSKWMQYNKKWYYVSFGSVKSGKGCLGHKNEPYYNTEDEMLKIEKYDFESLSLDEIIIYNKIKTK